jgi:NitT/TauT family transport system permease protein
VVGTPVPWWRRPWPLRLLSIVAVLAAWEIYGRMIPAIFISRPSAVLAAAGDLMVGPEFWTQLRETVLALLIGYTIAVLVGAALGFLIGRFRTLAFVLDPYVNIIYATPYVTLIPLLIIIFGIDLKLRLSIILLSTVFPILINTANGVRGVDPELLETAVAFNATERQILRTVIIPATLPFLLSGMQIALGRAIIAVIVAEMTVGVGGVGGLIVGFGTTFQTAYMLVPILATSALSVGLVNVLRVMERELMPYRFLGRRRSALAAWLLGRPLRAGAASTGTSTPRPAP